MYNVRSIVVRVISRLRMILLEPEVSREEVMQILSFPSFNLPY